ncbi:MAG: phosphotransferase family protein [Ilumatobacter sp.]|uniref:phosphotransferase family protein n=1 Tax=Ilumatobacter sp. TaxID=1967498 RepID=UPI002637666F|nr:phosphotransferase family protein [Ilumatobacter sp.]MDJ0770595.1 phosphotransferase family protein [Ilumatobacter sp.]
MQEAVPGFEPEYGEPDDAAPVDDAPGAVVVGFDVDVVDAWLPTVTDVTGPIRWERLPGGHSNLTYLLTDAAGRELVIRRPPQGELLPKAHDMWREYRIIDALWATAVPVAEPIAYCDDRSVAETHFYVMGKVEGEALYTGEVVSNWLDEPARRRAGESFVDVLAALHAVDIDEVGLGELGRRDGYVARQLKTWYGSWNASIEYADHDDERIHDLHSMLTDRLPEQGPARVVHGDYGPHNGLFARDGTLMAVLDWEIATLGDPLADFAYSLNAWVEPGDVGVYGADPPTALPGFPSRDELTERYAAATGADLSQLAYYRTFNSFKTACILHGVYARYRAGQKSSDDVDLDMLFARIGLSTDAAITMSAEIG